MPALWQEEEEGMKCWKSPSLECKDCGHRPDCDAYQSHERYKRRCFELTGENTELQQRLETARLEQLRFSGRLVGLEAALMDLTERVRDAANVSVEVAAMMLPAESTQQRCNCYQVTGKQCDSCRRKEEHE